MFRSFGDIYSKLKKDKVKRNLVIANANDPSSVEAAIYAHKKDIVQPLFIGNKDIISEILHSFSLSEKDFYIEDIRDAKASCERAVSLIKEGKAQIIMKGNVDTSVFLKAFTDKKEGLSQNRIMSHTALFEVPALKRIIAVVDGGMIPYPSISEKKAIIENTAQSLLDMGWEKPKAAVITCIEKVNPKMPETVEADLLKKMYLNGEIKNCIVDGPLSFDCAVSEEICEKKGFKSPVAGKADILLMPDIHAANICGKTLLTTAGAKMAGFISGGICPIILSSRAASPEEKFYSIVTGSASFVSGHTI